METALLRLVLEVDPMAQPVAGTVRGVSDTTQAFTGWIQLGHILDAVIAEARENPRGGELDRGGV